MPRIAKPKEPKVAKPKYIAEDFIKFEEDKLKIKKLLETKYICVNMATGGEILIPFDAKLKKFKPTQKDLKAFENLFTRLEFKKPVDDVELSPLVTFPTEENLKAFESCKEFGFDLETAGIEKVDDAFYPEKGYIRLIQVYVPEIKKTILWDTGDLKNRKDLMSLPGIQLLRKKLNSWNVRVWIHNADFESKWCYHHLNCPINNVADSMILSQIYWAGLSRGFSAIGVKNPNSLQQVALRVLGVKPDKENQSYDYALPLGNSQYNYAAYDSELTIKCGKKLLEMCYAEGLEKVVEADFSAIPAFAMMNYRGIKTNVEKLKKIRDEYSEMANKVIQPWLDLFPNSNPASPKQVAECLFNQWGLKPTVIDKKTGLPKVCTDNPTLTPYALENPVIDALLFWRSLTKDVDYIKQYLENVINVRGFDVIRPNYRQNADNCTGRSSSRSPNMQNIPKITDRRKNLGLSPIRSAFDAPPGYRMILVDLAASHAQIARYVSQDAKLIEAHKSGIKLHFYTIQGILEIEGIKAEVKEIAKAKKDSSHPLHQKVSETYDPSKTVFYGGLNLNGAPTLQQSFLKKADMVLPLDVCKRYVDGGRKAYSGLYQCQLNLIKKANSAKEARQFAFTDEHGVNKKIGAFRGFYGTARSLDGGRLFIEKTPNKYKQDSWEVKGTDAVSYMWLRVEGTIIKKSLGKLVKHIRQNKIDGWICQTTHDEIGAIIKEEQAKEFADFMNRTITDCFREFVPDYEPDSWNPEDFLIDNWSQK